MPPTSEKNFFQGQKFANYKELCLFLNLLEPKGGLAKRNHMALLETYFTFFRRGQSLTITSILQDPKTLPANPMRKKRASFWDSSIHQILLHELAACPDHELYLTTKQALWKLGFCHPNISFFTPTQLAEGFYAIHPTNLQPNLSKVFFKELKIGLLHYAGRNLNRSLASLALDPNLSLRKETCGQKVNTYFLSWLGDGEELGKFLLEEDELEELKEGIKERTLLNFERVYEEELELVGEIGKFVRNGLDWAILEAFMNHEIDK
jgi:hypothetical protein